MMDSRPAGASKKLALLLPDLSGGGAERVALSQIDFFLKQGHEVELVLMRAEGELLPLLPPSVRLIELGATRIRDSFTPLVAYLRDAKPDALQALMWPLTVVAVLARAAARSETRLVLADHTTLSRQYDGRGALARLALRNTLRLFYPRADARVAVSQDAADDLAALGRIPRRSIDVIYNPVADPPPAGPAAPEVEALWGAGRGRRIVTVGKLKAEKEHALLIESFARMPDHPDSRLMIVGSGDLEQELRNAAQAAGVAAKVIMPGFTTDPWPYYRSADLFVLSSRFEGYPLVLVEALKCGLRIVSTDCESGPREILDGGAFGGLVPVGDAAALAAAMEDALAAPAQPERQIARAAALAGGTACARYLDLMLARRGLAPDASGR